MENIAISLEGLTKIYIDNQGNKLTALDNIDLKVQKGSFFALLGLNGAGKSSLINILAGTTTKTQGKISIMGYDIDHNPKMAKKMIGVVPQEVMLDTFFTVYESLEFFAGYYGIRPEKRKTDEILTSLGLLNKANQYPRQLSGGMKRRLLVAKAMVHSPAILILDEPTAGVDIELREQLWEYVKLLNSQGTTIILTTHYLEEAEALCNEFAFMNKGKIIGVENRQTITDLLNNDRMLIIDFNSQDQDKIHRLLYDNKTQLSSIASIEQSQLLVKLYDNNITQTIRILDIMNHNNIQVKDFKITQPSLNKVFRTLLQ